MTDVTTTELVRQLRRATEWMPWSKEAADRVERLEEENARLREALGLDQPYDLSSLLGFATMMGAHLLSGHSCDHHMYEEWEQTVQELPKAIKRIEVARAALGGAE